MEKNTAPATKTSNISPITPLARLRETALDASRDQSVPDSLAPAVVAVGADKMNVFYIGVDNPITVVVPGYKCSDLSARLVGEGKLIPLADCRYTAVVTKPGPVSIEIYIREKGVEKLLGVRQFRVKRIPDPAVRLGDRMGSTIPRGEIREALSQEVQTIMQNFDFDAYCGVTRFSIALQMDSSDIIEYTVTGNTIPANIREQAEKLLPGSRLYLLDVRTQCPGDAAPRNIGDAVYRISQ